MDEPVAVVEAWVDDPEAVDEVLVDVEVLVEDELETGWFSLVRYQFDEGSPRH